MKFFSCPAEIKEFLLTFYNIYLSNSLPKSPKQGHRDLYAVMQFLTAANPTKLGVILFFKSVMLRYLAHFAKGNGSPIKVRSTASDAQLILSKL
jgi:hypothetical protein